MKDNLIVISSTSSNIMSLMSTYHHKLVKSID